VGAHHERPDGRGYPLALAGEAIPIEARILAVADSYEAMTSDRAYSPSIGHTAARAELERCAGAQFDARVVEAFLAALQHDAEHAEAALMRL
jgi:HD-GYP domain-containing protein (c-di-GMP phosphodiesterase class II)